MSALMTPRPARRRRTRPAPAPGGQSALFGAGAAPVAPAAPEPAGSAPMAPAAPQAPVAPEPHAVPGPHSAPAEPAAAAAVSPETDTTARAHRHGPTLDDMVAGAWEGLLAGAPADCLVCGIPLTPRHSAGAGIVGGRCGGCGTTVS
jgi:hypothetical protein